MCTRIHIRCVHTCTSGGRVHTRAHTYTSRARRVYTILAYLRDLCDLSTDRVLTYYVLSYLVTYLLAETQLRINTFSSYFVGTRIRVCTRYAIYDATCTKECLPMQTDKYIRKYRIIRGLRFAFRFF